VETPMTMLRSKQKTAEELLASLNPPEFAVGGDIAEQNLLCAAGLPGSQSLDINAALVWIDEMAHHVGAEIQRNYHRSSANPCEGNNGRVWRSRSIG